jgi:hypothetical protein
MVHGQASWLERAAGLVDRFGQVSAARREPICFFIGPKAARSSGGPGAVEIASAVVELKHSVSDIWAAFRGSHRITTRQRDQYIRPLFGDVVPYIGFRCMAALAARRPVIVVSTGWDDALKQACRRLGVDYNPARVADAAKASAGLRKVLDAGKGVAAIYLNGCIEAGGDLYFADKASLQLDEEQLELLTACFSYETVVIGTSLTRGLVGRPRILEALLPPPAASGTAAKDEQNEDPAPLWVFERREQLLAEPGVSTEAGELLTEVLAARQSLTHYITSPDVDFDALLVAIRGNEVGQSWSDLVRASGLQLPDTHELVTPDAPTMRSLLDVPAVLLVGRPNLGTTTIAVTLAYWRWLLSDEPNSRRICSGPGDSFHEVQTGGMQAEEPQERRIRVLDMAFGDGAWLPDAEGVAKLVEIAQRGEDVIVTSAPAAWLEVETAFPQLGQALEVTPLYPAILWSRKALKAHVQRIAPERARELCPQIERRILRTPLEVHVAIKRMPVRASDQVEQLTEHLLRLRARNPALARLLALVRLQDLSAAVPAGRLARLAGTSVAEALEDPWDIVECVEVDEQHLRLARPAARQAIDRWLQQDEQWLTAELRRLRYKGRWAADALALWRTLNAFDLTAAATRSIRDEHLPLLALELIERARAGAPAQACEVVGELLKRQLDPWTFREVVLAMTLAWDDLRRAPASRMLLADVLGDRDRFGAAALLDALLVRRGVPPLDLLCGTIDTLIGLCGVPDRHHELVLAHDALCSGALGIPHEQYEQLEAELLGAARKDGRLRAAFALSLAYRSGDSRSEASREPLVHLGDVGPEGAQEMAWLMHWHLIEQSRARAALTRRPLEAVHELTDDRRAERFLARTQHPEPLGADARLAIESVFRQMARFQHTTGWAIHLLLNARCTRGDFQAEGLVLALENTPKSDDGLLTALVTYDPGRDVVYALRSDLKGDALKALLGCLGLGLPLPEVPGLAGADLRARRPSFLACRDGWRVRRLLNVDASPLDRHGLAHHDPDVMMEQFYDARERLISTRSGLEALADDVLERMASGDSIPLEHAIQRAGSKRASAMRLPPEALLRLAIDQHARPEQLDLLP